MMGELGDFDGVDRYCLSLAFVVFVVGTPGKFNLIWENVCICHIEFYGKLEFPKLHKQLTRCEHVVRNTNTTSSGPLVQSYLRKRIELQTKM